jgi:hypothetical protein
LRNVAVGYGSSMRVGILGCLLVAGTASAEPAVSKTAEPPAEDRNLFYVELLGKAGAYGVGYERAITDRLSLGAAVSYADVRDQQIFTASPYVHARLLGTTSSLFTELGAVFVHTRIPSPVPEWDGMNDSGGGGFASLGWQRSWKHVVVRASGSVLVGEGGVTPWAGIAFGVKR